MSSRSRPVGAGPSFSVILLAGATYVSPAAALAARRRGGGDPGGRRVRCPRGRVRRRGARADGRSGVRGHAGRTFRREPVWQALADAAAGAIPTPARFASSAHGLTPERAWRGRRCQVHERNLESLRFAHLIAPGALVVRRELIDAAAAGLAPGLGADWWRALTRQIAATSRVADVDDGRRPHGAASPASRPVRASRPRLDGVDVLVFGQIEVSTSLYFDFLESAPGRHRRLPRLHQPRHRRAASRRRPPRRAGAHAAPVLGRRRDRLPDAPPAYRSSGSPTTTSWRCAPSTTRRHSTRAAACAGRWRRGGGLDLYRRLGRPHRAAAPGREGLGPGAGPAAEARRAAAGRPADRRAAGRRFPRLRPRRRADPAAARRWRPPSRSASSPPPRPARRWPPSLARPTSWCCRMERSFRQFVRTLAQLRARHPAASARRDHQCAVQMPDRGDRRRLPRRRAGGGGRAGLRRLGRDRRACCGSATTPWA